MTPPEITREESNRRLRVLSAFLRNEAAMKAAGRFRLLEAQRLRREAEERAREQAMCPWMTADVIGIGGGR